MKKLLLLIALVVITMSGFSQTAVDSTCIALLEDISSRIERLENSIKEVEKYKIYPTTNIYISLKLNTATGQIDLVQWSLDDNKEFIVPLNSVDLSWGLKSINGTFELYSTQNIYQFLLLDKTDGRVWHVQWGVEEKKRWIKRIY